MCTVGTKLPLRLISNVAEVDMKIENNDSHDPKVHTAHVRQAMRDLIEHLRQDIGKVDEPRAQALFEASAEVLQGLIKTYDDYDAGKEAAFRR
jgi:hypothetical protein